MKLQFAFGNPTRSKRKSKAKGVAKGRKKKKTVHVSKAGRMHKKKHKKHHAKKHHAKKRHGKRNPEYFKVFKGGKEVYQSRQFLDADEERGARSKIASALAKYKGLPLGAAKAAALKEYYKTGSLQKALKMKEAELKTRDAYAKEGALIKKIVTGAHAPRAKHSKMSGDEKHLASLKEQYKKASGAGKSELLKKMLKLSTKITKAHKSVKKKEAAATKKAMGAWAKAASGVVKPKRKSKGSKVAKKKKKTKAKPKSKSKVKRKTVRKPKHTVKRKTTKAKSHKAKHKAKSHKAKHKAKSHKAKGSHAKRGKKKKYVKMIKHRHSIQTRHIRKGGTTSFKAKKHKRHYSVKSYFGKGKKKVKMTGRISVNKKGLHGIFKINPFRRLKNMVNIKAEKITGHSNAELIGLAVGGASVPFFNKLMSKFAPALTTTVSNYVGAQNAGAVLPILGGIAINVIAELDAVRKYRKTSDAMRVVGEGMTAAGVISLAMGVSNNYVLPMVGPSIGLAGVPYGMNGVPYGMNGIPSGLGIYPQLNGVQYTPDMHGVQYTPMSGINYTPDMSGVDFGSANYGGGGGTVVQTPGDFGADWSQDSIAEHWGDEDDELSSAMN